MHIISFKKLREFFEQHPQAETPLRAWHQDMQANHYGSLNEIKHKYPSADWVKPFVIFNIGGNDFRLVVVIHFNRGKVFVREVFTHAQYDLWNKLKTKQRKKKGTA